MRGRMEDGQPGDEAEVENDVLPLPLVADERALRAELDRLDGTWTEGPLSVIAVPRPGGGQVYLAGQTTLFSNFSERAYVMGEEQAGRLVQRFPLVLGGAEVVVRGRRHLRSHSRADRQRGVRSTGPNQRPQGQSANGSADNSAQHPSEHGEGQDRQAESEGEQDDRQEEADDPDDQAADDEDHEQPGEEIRHDRPQFQNEGG